MKKLLYSLLILALAASCGKGNITVNGSIAEGQTYPSSQLLYFMDGKTVLDSCAVVDGKFTLKAPANPQKMYRICISPSERIWNFGIIAEKGTFPVTMTAKPGDCTIDKAPLNQRYADFNQELQDVVTEYRDKLNALDDDAEEEAEEIYEELTDNIKDLSLEAIKKNPDNYIARAALMNVIYDLDLDELKGIVSKSKFLGEDESVARILRCKEAEIATAEGKPFVDFGGKTPVGDSVRLSDFVGKGKWVLADFWASWCGPCMREIPNIKKTHETLSGDKFTVLGVAVWDDDNTASGATMVEKEMTWPQIFVGEDNTPTDVYGITGIPTMILFAPDGTICKRGDSLRGEKMMETVRDIINQ